MSRDDAERRYDLAHLVGVLTAHFENADRFLGAGIYDWARNEVQRGLRAIAEDKAIMSGKMAIDGGTLNIYLPTPEDDTETCSGERLEQAREAEA